MRPVLGDERVQLLLAAPVALEQGVRSGGPSQVWSSSSLIDCMPSTGSASRRQRKMPGMESVMVPSRSRRMTSGRLTRASSQGDGSRSGSGSPLLHPNVGDTRRQHSLASVAGINAGGDDCRCPRHMKRPDPAHADRRSWCCRCADSLRVRRLRLRLSMRRRPGTVSPRPLSPSSPSAIAALVGRRTGQCLGPVPERAHGRSVRVVSPSQTLDLYLPAATETPSPLSCSSTAARSRWATRAWRRRRRRPSSTRASPSPPSTTDSAVRRSSPPAPRMPRRRSASCGQRGGVRDRPRPHRRVGILGRRLAREHARSDRRPGDRLRRSCAGQPGRVQRRPGGGELVRPTDFATMDEQAADVTACGGQSQAHGAADSPESRWLGGALADVPEITALTDLGSYVAGAPERACLLLRPRRLRLQRPRRPVAPARQFSTVAGAAQTVAIVEGAGHADPLIDEQQTAPSIAFLRAPSAAHALRTMAP